MFRLEDFLTSGDRAAIRKPLADARTFTRRCFTSEQFYQYELNTVFKETWLAISYGFLLANPGDMLPTVAFGLPVLLVRGSDQVVRAFHNVCPYDGCEVVIRPRFGEESIVTPYHGWEYDFEGKLVAANYFDGTQLSRSTNMEELNADLIPIPCEEWLGAIFIYNGTGKIDFCAQYEPVLRHIEKLDLHRLTVGSDENEKPLICKLTINANWKTVYENYSPNVYHESFVHAMYRKSPHSPRVDADGNKTYTEINDPSGFLGLYYDNSIGGSFYGESELPAIRNKDGSVNTINTIANAFPNWVITILADTLRISMFLPESCEKGTQMIATFFDQDGATGRELMDARKKSHHNGVVARKEDNWICESIQRGRHSPAVNSQFYSPFWDAMHYTLNNLILDKLEAGNQHDATPG